MKLLPLFIIIVLLIAMYLFSKRTRERAAAEQEKRRDGLSAGSEVMTTSGLYGTVVSIDRARDIVVLQIAPGVEVTWAILALRPRSELPEQYQPGLAGGEERTDDAAGQST